MKYALIVGNSEYNDTKLAQLTAPSKDAEDFAKVLRDKNIGAFDNVKVLFNETEHVIREAIDEFFDQKKPDDLLVLYFSGHGIRDEYGSLYLAVKNTNWLRLRATAVKSSFIREVMDQSRSRRQVLILDCCNSGAFPHGSKAATGVSIGTSTAFQGYGRVILTASDSTEFAYEGDQIIGETNNSLFTHFLVEGLQGEADLNGDGKISIDELYDYAYEKVKFATPKQNPSKFSDKQQGEIILRDNIHIENIKPVSLSDEILNEAEDTRPHVRENAVRTLDKILKGKNIALAISAKKELEKIIQDDNTTRRVADLATQALKSFNQNAERKSDDEKTSDQSTPFTRTSELRREKDEQAKQFQAEQERILKEKKDLEERVSQQKIEIEKSKKNSWVLPTTTIGAIITLILLCVLMIAVNSYNNSRKMIVSSTDTAIAKAQNTEIAIVENTSIAKVTNTAIARATNTAIALATVQARDKFVSTQNANSQLVFGPQNDSLQHEDDDYVEINRANLNLRDFIIEATFLNPYSTTIGSWDFGFMFRDEGGNEQFRLIITSNKWGLQNWTGSADTVVEIASGELSNLKLDKGSSNTLLFYCKGNKGILYVNTDFIAEIDLSARINSGDVLIGTGFSTKNEITGYSTDYIDFIVWEIP